MSSASTLPAPSVATIPEVGVLTPPGRGAVATLRIRGPGERLDGNTGRPPLCRCRNGIAVAAQPIGRIAFAQWGPTDPEDVVLCRVAPDEWEVHCHGGRAAVARIVGDLKPLGFTVEDPAITRQGGPVEWARRAVPQATTLKTADWLLQQATAAWPRAVAEFATCDAADLKRRCDEMRRWSKFGRRLTTPWAVALIGRPNAGKSSLMNALSGFTRSIVHDQPGTTRDAVTMETAFQGWPVRLIDTAGIRESPDEIETSGIERARRAAEGADLVVIVTDLSKPPTAESRTLLAEFPEALAVMNKCDLKDAWGTEVPSGALAISATSLAGLTELVAAIVRRLIPELPPSGLAIPVSEEHEAWLAERSTR